MTTKNQVNFKTLLNQGLISGTILILIDYFLFKQFVDLIISSAAVVSFTLVYLAIMCWMYEIKPFKGRWSSPFKE